LYKIDRIGRRMRLEADAILTPADFASIAEDLGQLPVRARKIGYVAAREARTSEVVETRWNGKETTNTARPGDFIVTNLSPQRQPLVDDGGHMNVYVIAAEIFADFYEPTSETSEHGTICRAKGVVSALPFPCGLDIIAPWGERQAVADGYLLLNGDEVYGSSADAFEATYEAI
jgi:hypothetical protein